MTTRMKANKRLLYATCTAISLTMLLASCQDDISGIGESVSRGEVVITIDSVGFKLNGRSVAAPVIDSRSTTNMLGRLSIPEYGDLRCSFVSRLISISELSIPDSITADSISHFRMILNIPRGQVTGDSLAPQRLKVYELTKQLPDAINNQFDPPGYYSESSLLGTRSYTASAVALGDSAYTKLTSIPLSTELPLEKGKKVFEEYRNNPATFAWPASFAKFFPGIYVENDFGKGCVFNISNVKFNLYWRKRIKTSAVIDSVTTQVDKIVTDSLTVFATAPEVLSSNNISLTPSSAVTDAIARGEVMMQSPAGYNVEINFPAQEIIDEYSKQSSNLSIVNNLTLSIPVEHTSNLFVGRQVVYVHFNARLHSGADKGWRTGEARRHGIHTRPGQHLHRDFKLRKRNTDIRYGMRPLPRPSDTVPSAARQGENQIHLLKRTDILTRGSRPRGFQKPLNFLF